MRRAILFLFLVGVATASGSSQTCSVAANIPSDQTRLGAGTATAHYEGTTAISGGQAAYVKITNRNVLGVSYELTIAQNTIPARTICTYKAILPQTASAILWGALFGEPPIGWKITVAIGPESDAGVLTYDVYSRSVKDSPIFAMVNEHATANLNCSGGRILSIQFASYGLPNGSPNRFSYGPCNAGNSFSVVSGRCIGRPACSVPAENNVFGDPCVNRVKRLYIQATCRR